MDWCEALEVLGWGSSFTCVEVPGHESPETLGLTSSSADGPSLAWTFVEVCVEEFTCCTDWGRGGVKEFEEQGRGCACLDVPDCGADFIGGMAWLTVVEMALISLEVEAVDELEEEGIIVATL